MADQEKYPLEGAKLAGRFQLSLLIGKGSFGSVYLGFDHQENQLCAIKLESQRTKHPQLQHESKLIDSLKEGIGMPQLYWQGVCDQSFQAMAISVLGPSLEDLFNMCNRKFSLKSTIMLVDQMIARLQYMHSKNFLHRDLKPDNFLIGIGKKSNVIYLIDFGLAKKYRDHKSHVHIPYKENKTLAGTARYASINAHLGIEQSRRDDLQGIGYVMIYMLNGGLPWQGQRAQNKQEKYHKIMEKKMQMSNEELCADHPVDVSTVLNYIHSLKFEDKPDYRFLRKTLRELFFRCKFQWDYAYDWTIPPPNGKDLEYTSHFLKVTISYNQEEEEPEKEESEIDIQMNSPQQPLSPLPVIQQDAFEDQNEVSSSDDDEENQQE